MQISRALRLFTVYVGLAFIGDKLIRPEHGCAQGSEGSRETGPPRSEHRTPAHFKHRQRQMFQAPALWGDVNVDTDARAAALDERLTYADPTALPFEDDSFGAIILLHIVEDAEDPLALAKEADRVVAPGGIDLRHDPSLVDPSRLVRQQVAVGQHPPWNEAGISALAPKKASAL